MSEFFEVMGPMIVFALAILGHVVGASKFSSIAEEKGYEGYFWWCLLVPAFGELMVLALPDKKGREQIISAIINSQQVQTPHSQYYMQQPNWNNYPRQ